jgi:hypothetical protein
MLVYGVDSLLCASEIANVPQWATSCTRSLSFGDRKKFKIFKILSHLFADVGKARGKFCLMKLLLPLSISKYLYCV